MHKKYCKKIAIFNKLATGFKLTVDKFGGGVMVKKEIATDFKI